MEACVNGADLHILLAVPDELFGSGDELLRCKVTCGYREQCGEQHPEDCE